MDENLGNQRTSKSGSKSNSLSMSYTSDDSSSSSSSSSSSNNSRSFDKLKNQLLGDDAIDAAAHKVNDNDNDNANADLKEVTLSNVPEKHFDANTSDSSFHAFYEKEVGEDKHHQLQLDQMSDAERQRQLEHLLNEMDDSTDRDSSRDASVGASTVGFGLGTMGLDVQAMGKNVASQLQASSSTSTTYDSPSRMHAHNPETIDAGSSVPEINMDVAMDARTNSEDDDVLEVSSSSSSSDSSSSSGPSSVSSARSDHPENEETHDITEEGMVNVTSSKSTQISEFDRAMTNVGRGEAHTKVSYSNIGSSKQGLSIQVPPDSTNTTSNPQHSYQTPTNGDIILPTNSVSPSTIEQVRTLDEDDDGVETALEMSLSISLSRSKSYPGSKSRDEEESSNASATATASVTTEGQDMALANSKMYSQGTSVAPSTMTDSSAVALTRTISLAQQIKQSIDQTPSKPLPKTVKPSQELPTMRHTAVTSTPTTIRPKSNDLPSNSLPDVFTSVRDKIDGLFDNERRGAGFKEEDEQSQLNRENLRRAFQQSVSAAVLVILAHKRYERRRLAAMEIEKVVRTLVQSRELERVKGILLLLSDDYVRSTNEDARKGGVVAMAACAIGLKKAHDMPGLAGKTNECTDLILGSVVHACQDNSQRVRYYATESLFNVIKVLPSLAVEHFFILFEILSSLSADVDVDVRSGAELLDKKLQGIIIGSINTGQFDADTCVPLFARFLHMRNKQTKRLTLTWLQAFGENLIGAPLLEFLHLFLYDVFAMLADPSSNIHQLALLFLNSMLPKLWMKNEDFEDSSTYNKVDFDKILQSLVTTMEHPDPFVRKVAMYWVFRIVQAHMGDSKNNVLGNRDDGLQRSVSNPNLHAASVSVRNALEHVLPGLLLSIGDTFQTRAKMKDTFLPDQTTHYLADQTNRCLQNNVRREGRNYVSHLGGFVVALREELDTPGGLSGKNRTAKERKPYRMDVKTDGSGIESTGWFRTNGESADEGEATGHENILSRLCALEWIELLFEYVVPDVLKDEVSWFYFIFIFEHFVWY